MTAGLSLKAKKSPLQREGGVKGKLLDLYP